MSSWAYICILTEIAYAYRTGSPTPISSPSSSSSWSAPPFYAQFPTRFRSLGPYFRSIPLFFFDAVIFFFFALNFAHSWGCFSLNFAHVLLHRAPLRHSNAATRWSNARTQIATNKTKLRRFWVGLLLICNMLSSFWRGFRDSRHSTTVYFWLPFLCISEEKVLAPLQRRSQRKLRLAPRDATEMGDCRLGQGA